MRLGKLLGISAFACLAVTSAVAATASAESLPNILPLGTATDPILGNSTSGSSIFGNGLIDIESGKSEGTIDLTSTKLGTFSILLLEVENAIAAVKCKGLSATIAGAIPVFGTFHIRDFKENATLLIAAIFLLVPVHFECGAATLVILSGCVAGALTPENALTSTLTVTLAKSNVNAGDNLIITVLNEANTANELCQLLAKQGTSATKLSFWETTQTLTNFKKDPSSTAIEVLVMRL